MRRSGQSPRAAGNAAGADRTDSDGPTPRAAGVRCLLASRHPSRGTRLTSDPWPWPLAAGRSAVVMRTV